MTYFNTNALDGSELRNARRESDKQENLVFAFFRAHPFELYTPDQVWGSVFDVQRVPLTSVRRAMTVLTNAGRLVRTETMRTSRYGKPAHCWQYRPNEPQQARLL